MHRKNMYDNVDEYYVIVKETGSREEQATQEEIQRKIGKATQLPIYIYIKGTMFIPHNIPILYKKTCCMDSP